MMGLEEQKTYLKLLAMLLQYPDDSLLSRLPELQAIAGLLPPCDRKNSLEQFMCYLKTKATLCVKELYTTAFDLNPSTTLNITYHLWGNSEKRADSLAYLRQLYLDAGYECVTGELPDYLPLMLEFLALCPQAQGNDLIRECLQTLEGLVRRLQETALPYAALLQPLTANPDIS